MARKACLTPAACISFLMFSACTGRSWTALCDAANCPDDTYCRVFNTHPLCPDDVDNAAKARCVPLPAECRHLSETCRGKDCRDCDMGSCQNPGNPYCMVDLSGHLRAMYCD